MNKQLEKMVNRTEEEIVSSLESLEDIVKEYNQLREEFGFFINIGNFNPDSLCLFRTRFTDLQAATVPILSIIHGLKVSRDEGARSMFKSQITRRLVGTEGPSGRLLTEGTAYNLAGAEEDYKDFMKERVLYYEAHTKIYNIFHTIENYIYDIAGRLSKTKTYQRFSEQVEETNDD